MINLAFICSASLAVDILVMQVSNITSLRRPAHFMHQNCYFFSMKFVNSHLPGFPLFFFRFPLPTRHNQRAVTLHGYLNQNFEVLVLLEV